MDLFAPTHLLIILVIILVIFGPSKLGDVGGAMGKAIRDFKRAMNQPDNATTPLAKPDEVKPPKPPSPTKFPEHLRPSQRTLSLVSFRSEAAVAKNPGFLRRLRGL